MTVASAADLVAWLAATSRISPDVAAEVVSIVENDGETSSVDARLRKDARYRRQVVAQAEHQLAAEARRTEAAATCGHPEHIRNGMTIVDPADPMRLCPHCEEKHPAGSDLVRVDIGDTTNHNRNSERRAI